MREDTMNIFMLPIPIRNECKIDYIYAEPVENEMQRTDAVDKILNTWQFYIVISEPLCVPWLLCTPIIEIIFFLSLKQI